MSKAAKIRPIRDNIYFFDKETNEKKSKYDKVSRDLRYIPRANTPDKSLSKGARSLATNYYDMISKSCNGTVFVSHDFISSITEVGHSQNKRYHNELRDLFNIQYHQSAIIDDKKYRDGFAIQFTENTEIILKNPKLFYSSQDHKNEQLSVQKRTPRRSKMDASLYIYKEKPIDKQNSYIANGSINFENENFTENSRPVEKSHKANFLDKKFVFENFYPLSQEDASNLRSLSGRNFELLPMNEILLKIHNYILATGRHLKFDDKDHFLRYFAKRLAVEKRDAYKINNISFRINANIPPEEKEAKQRDKYLEQMENSGDSFKRFIAARLSERKAYDFLTAFRSLDIEDNTVKIRLDKHLELSETDLKLILQEIQRTHSKEGGSFADGIIKMLNPDPKDQINKIELITPNSTKKVKEMSNINQQILDSFGSTRGQEILNICSISERPDKAIQVQIKTGETIPEHDKPLLRQCIKTIYGEVEIHTNKPKAQANVIHLDQRNDTNWPLWETRADLWERFKKGMLEQLRPSEGEHIFKAWFSNLERSQDISAKKLTLAGKEFWISYISQNYSRLLEHTAKNQKINITLVYEGKQDEPGYKPIIFTPTEGRKF